MDKRPTFEELTQQVNALQIECGFPHYWNTWLETGADARQTT